MRITAAGLALACAVLLLADVPVDAKKRKKKKKSASTTSSSSSSSASTSVSLSSGVDVEFSDAAASPTLMKWASALDAADGSVSHGEAVAREQYVVAQVNSGSWHFDEQQYVRREFDPNTWYRFRNAQVATERPPLAKIPLHELDNDIYYNEVCSFYII